MQLSFSIAFLVMGFVQGILLVYIAFFNKAMNQVSHKLLGLFIVILTLATLGTFANHELEDFSNPTWLRLLVNYFPYYFIVIAGPTAYLHCKSLLESNFKLRKLDLLHFLPVILELVPFIGFLILSFSIIIYQNEVPENGIFKSLQLYQRLMEIPRILSLIVYMILTLNLFRKHKNFSNSNIYRWVKIMLIFGVGIISIFFLDLFIFFSPLYESIGKKFQLEVYTIYYPIVGFIYLLSTRIIFRQAPWFLGQEDLSEIWDRVVSDKNLLSNEKQKIFNKLNQIILDHIDDSNLTIELIAYHLNASRSKAINLIKELTGNTPLAYIKTIRMEYVDHLIQTDKIKNASEAAKSIGMTNPTQFSQQYEKKFGKIPF